MISARLSILYTILSLYLLQAELQAQVIVEKRVNSWDQPGYLMVMGTIGVAFSLCLFFTYYEYRRKKHK